MDAFIDVAQLRALDRMITAALEARIQAQSDKAFYTGPHKLDDNNPELPGSRIVYLSRSQRDDRYLDLDRAELWALSDDAAAFAPLMDFIRTLPFKSTGRMLIIYDTVLRPVTAHRDHMEQDICHEFIWFRTNKKKPFYMLDHKTGRRLYVETYSAWFDTVNQFHGSDGYDGLSFSIRVDGVFTDEFRRQIPQPEYNRASTPALWASLSETNISLPIHP